MRYSAKQYAQALFEALSETKPGHHNRILDNFANLLKQQGELGRIAEIEQAYVDYEKTVRGVKIGSLASARELSPAEEGKVMDRLNEFVGTNIDLKTKIDKGLLGGFVVRLGDKLIDGSTRRNLQELKNNLST